MSQERAAGAAAAVASPRIDPVTVEVVRNAMPPTPTKWRRCAGPPTT